MKGEEDPPGRARRCSKHPSWRQAKDHRHNNRRRNNRKRKRMAERMREKTRKD